MVQEVHQGERIDSDIFQGWSAEYGSFYQDLGCANNQNLGSSAQKFVRCAMKNLLGAPKYI